MFNLRQRISSAANRIKSFFFGSAETDSIDRDIASIDRDVASIDEVNKSIEQEFKEPKRTVWIYEWAFDEPDQPDVCVSSEISVPDPSHKPEPPDPIDQQEPTGQQEPLVGDPLEEPDPTDEEPNEEARLMEEYERWIAKTTPSDEPPLDPEPFHEPDDTDDLDDDGHEFHLARYLMDDEYSRQIDEDYGWSDFADAVESVWFEGRQSEVDSEKNPWGLDGEGPDQKGNKVYHLWELEARTPEGKHLELRAKSLSPFLDDVQNYIDKVGSGADYFHVVYATDWGMYAAVYFDDA